MTLLQSGITKSLAEDYTIDQSLRFNNPDGAYLTRTPTSDGNRKTWTFSAWVKLGKMGTIWSLFSAGADGGGPRTNLTIHADGNLEHTFNPSGSDNLDWRTSAHYRDPSAWYHVVIAMDTTQSVATDRQKIYVNGEQITDFEAQETIPEDSEGPVNQNVAQDIANYSAAHGSCATF